MTRPWGGDTRERMRAISRGMDKEFRHVGHPTMQSGVYLPLVDLLNAETLRELWETQDDVREIARWAARTGGIVSTYERWIQATWSQCDRVRGTVPNQV